MIFDWWPEGEFWKIVILNRLRYINAEEVKSRCNDQQGVIFRSTEISSHRIMLGINSIQTLLKLTEISQRRVPYVPPCAYTFLRHNRGKTAKSAPLKVEKKRRGSHKRQTTYDHLFAKYQALETFFRQNEWLSCVHGVGNAPRCTELLGATTFFVMRSTSTITIGHRPGLWNTFVIVRFLL